jgi:hypothetical protein
MYVNVPFFIRLRMQTNYYHGHLGYLWHDLRHDHGGLDGSRKDCAKEKAIE